MNIIGGDFNGDGKNDLMVQDTSAASGHLYFYPGNGTGTFGTRTDLGANYGGLRLTAIDFNNDHKLDLLAIYPGNDHLYFYPGTGTGTLGTRTDLGVGWTNFQLTAGDFTGDGKDDFAADDTTNHKVYVYPGTGSGTFSARIPQADTWTSYGIPVAGRFDYGSGLGIAATDSSSHVRTWSGDGAGHFSGALTATTAYTGSRTLYSYDDDGNTRTQSGPAGTAVYRYDPAADLTATILPTGNGYTEKRSYDNDGRLTEISSTKGSTTFADWQLTLDEAGQLQRVDVNRSGKPASHQYYTYDSAGLLLTDCTSATLAAQCPAADATAGTTYTYDGVGNRTTATTAGTLTTYTYDAADQLSNALTGNKTTSYTYDKNGNQTGDGTNTFTYDATSHLSSLTTPSATYTYGYDAEGNRTSASKAGTGLLRNTIWDPNYDLPQVAAEYGASGSLIAAYQYNPLEQIQSQTTSAAAPFYYHHDQLGSVTDITDTAGALQTSYSYTAYGALTQTDTATNPPTNRFTYTGQYKEPTTNAAGYDLRARNYDPTTGRFTSTDPIQLRPSDPYTSAYSYAGNSPTNGIDPSGQNWLDPITSRLQAIGSGLKESAELPFTFVGDLADAVSGRNGGAGNFLDTYFPIRPAYRLYRAAEMLHNQGCDQLADQYDAAGDQLTQQLAVTVLGGFKGGWSRYISRRRRDPARCR
ncbi:FG-GAP-like repeat-containing protein [Actinacidiphila sp. DG2A-62]|uniref:RHS repeat domain-containing protein n=1 Tax=Actinacidiphila sp. DG2A-62 TaxID=3108821 RepID=UPI002DBB014B|nr:FG-GAP-like repeat-containing protein [Actinacidiphila sp. DG2A-62]MEC3998880.1 FG-GAP-like repeat-containing protein [Actinacidiphila sp. DG2A-62]